MYRLMGFSFKVSAQERDFQTLSNPHTMIPQRVRIIVDESGRFRQTYLFPVVIFAVFSWYLFGRCRNLKASALDSV